MKFSTVILVLSLMLAGCASSAPEFGGRWRPVNRFSETPQSIPLYQTYEFYATPLDGSLKGMLTRWATDNNMKLAYEAPMDYTLFGAIAELRTQDLADATSRLSALYASQGVVVMVETNRIVVRPAPIAAADIGVSN